MARTFSMPTVLRMAPKDLLSKVFEELGYFECMVPWKIIDPHEITPIMECIEKLLPNQQNEIEGVLRSISDLACDTGLQAIEEAGPQCMVFGLSESFADELSMWGRVILVWLQHRRVFDRAQVIHQVDRLAWWRTRTDLPSTEPKTDQETTKTLSAEISKLLKGQGRGKSCTVESMSRDDVTYFFAYPDDFVQHVTFHDEHGKLAAAAVRQTLQVVFAYNREEGTLETFAVKLGKREKERLEWLFAATVLSHNLGKHEPPPAFSLEHIKKPDFRLAVDPSDRLKVRIRKMRLNPPNGRRVQVEVDDDDSIHAAIHECLNLDEIPLDRWTVRQVTFVFEFQHKEGRKHGKEIVEIGHPRTGGVKSTHTERAEIIQKYLRRWEIIHVTTATPDTVEVGVESADRQPNRNDGQLRVVVENAFGAHDPAPYDPSLGVHLHGVR